MIADDLARRAGVRLEDVARSWPCPRYKMSEKTLKSRVRRIRQVTERGGINDASAIHLGNLLKVSPIVFLRGWDHSRG